MSRTGPKRHGEGRLMESIAAPVPQYVREDDPRIPTSAQIVQRADRRARNRVRKERRRRKKAAQRQQRRSGR